jgi:hypothetical protein
MFRHEYRAATRSHRPFLFRSFVGVVLGAVTLLVGLLVFKLNPRRDLSAQDRIVAFGIAVLIASICVELLVLLFSIPAFAGGAVAEERQKNTLPLLLLTRLTPLEIVLTKAAARWMTVIPPVLIGLPILLVSGWLAGRTDESVLAVLGLLSGAGFMTTLAILSSAQRDQVGTARAQAMAWNFGWLIVPPAVAAAPITGVGLLGELWSLLKSVCSLAAPSSPLSLVTDRAWYYRTGVFGLEGRIAEMVLLQSLFGLVLLWLASAYLKARDTNPNWTDPTRGYRPPCGDDPVYWREYELPTRRGGSSRIVLLLRTLGILIRAILINILSTVGVLLVLALPIGLLVATGHYGFGAFRELWQHGYGPTGPFDQRTRFNMVLRVSTGMLALLPAMNLISIVSGRITADKDKRSWDALLTTPLQGEEILRSKARAAIQGLRQPAKILVVLGALGLVCGVVTPLGVALTAIDLVLAVWAGVALGLYLGIRPGETAVTASRASWITLAFFALHASLLYSALASPRELAAAASWDARLRWGVVLAGLAVPISTGAVAWGVTMRTFERFDEWVGRPIAGGVDPDGPDPTILLPAAK